MIEKMNEETYPRKKKVIYSEGDKDSYIYLVKQGEVEV